MKTTVIGALLLGLGTLSSTASAQAFQVPPITNLPPIQIVPDVVCFKNSKAWQFCSSGDLANAGLRQIVFLSAGFTDKSAFFATVGNAIGQMTGAGNAWSAQKKDQLLFVAIFTDGGSLGAGIHSSVRGDVLTVDPGAVRAAISSHPGVRPLGAAVIFDSDQHPVVHDARLAPRTYGIAQMTRYDIDASPYVTTHELGHAALNFLDEYSEHGLEDQNITQLDALTPLAQLDGSWGGFVDAISNIFGVYSIQLSEILANNGNDNVARSRWPATVSTPGFTRPEYAIEGGPYFGRGTWHMLGASMMGSPDTFAYTHTPAQQRVIELAFGNTQSVRPNDRISTAGPINGWPLELGATTHVMMRDADKSHRFQPTKYYDVQVGWYDRRWKTCWQWGVIPYPCYDDIWTTAQKRVYPAVRTIDLKLTSAYGLLSSLQNGLCAAGVTQGSSSGATVQLCDKDLGTIATNFLPTTKLEIPYQDTDVPASQWFTTYWWRFSTNNGSVSSGQTGWSSFYRSF